MNNTESIPAYDLSSDYEINIESISHINPYDFKTVHRHNYYEILVFKKGGGLQQIDFRSFVIKDYSCYIVRPGQIHLVKRAPQADGLLIQFSETMILPDVFFNAMSFLNSTISSEILFEQNESATKKLLNLIRSIKLVQEKKLYFFKEKTVHLLSNLLYSIEEFSPNIDTTRHSGTNAVVNRFVELVQLNLNSISINEYSKKLNISTKKLSSLVKGQFNITPLKYVHIMLLTAIKRDLVFKKQSYKEIAFYYNFDSPSNFSIFIKKHTGKTPSQLQESLRKF